MPPTKYTSFDVRTVALKDSNLIEASAGTGKTFSIALMVIRLIIEKGIPIEKILMVTFTNAAVAELELRVRSFVRKALQQSISNTYNNSDDPISVIIKQAIENKSVDENKVIERLNTAAIFLDEVGVMTIHSFCQKILSEYSFETNQIFGAENISPDAFNELIEDFFNEFWRKTITTLDVNLLIALNEQGLSRDNLLQQVKNSIKGQKIISDSIINNIDVRFDTQNLQNIIDYINTTTNQISTIQKEIIDELIKNKTNYIVEIEKAGINAKKAFSQLYSEDNLEALVTAINSKKDTGYCKKIFSDTLLNNISQKGEIEATFIENIKIIITQISYLAAQEILIGINESKKVNGFITFDDMIELLYKAVVEKNNPVLKAALRQKYQAVFIDEFQDTDKLQYGIFNTVFGKDHILFYIGDPKQSIYGFRKADINTYLNAANSVDNLYIMNTNFRSNAGFIESMNCFFKPVPDFDTFALGTPPDFDYIAVNSPEENTKGYLYKNGAKTKTLSISTHQNKKNLLKGVINTVVELMNTTTYQIIENNKPRNVIPSDIGILVRKNSEGRIIKNMLSQYGIPSITVDDTKLLNSPEANELYYILEAVSSIEQGLINRALLSKIAGYTKEKLISANEEDILNRFKIYQESWKQKGVFVMLKQFISDHNLSARLLEANIENGERLVSNILQLIEIIHTEEVHKQYDSKELIQWLKRGIEGKATEGDEYEQRIENDEDAVKIITIHKCKGLEYNIVLSPSLDLLSDSKHESISFRNLNDFEYYAINKDLATVQEIEWAQKQAEQENRRLLYVAVTRARMHCFIYGNNASYYAKSCLKLFLKALGVPADVSSEMQNNCWEKWNPEVVINRSMNFLSYNKVAMNYATVSTAELPLLQRNWRKTSYSSLNPEHEITVYPKSGSAMEDTYDKFVFRELKKGAHTGNLLHYIFENIRFDDNKRWENTIEKSLNRLSTIKEENYIENIKQLLTHVMDVMLPVNSMMNTNKPFCLKELNNICKLNELEFDFSLKPFNTEALSALSTPDIPFSVKSYSEIEGIMNGKMDLFFMINDKYYLLDWKSNFLGESLEDYSPDKVALAMGENNYHLQYHIYTLAAKKYLSHCIADFDYDLHFGGVIYVFLRGVRTGHNKGLFLHRPSKEMINRIENIIS